MAADLNRARTSAEQFRAQYLTGQIYAGLPLDMVFIAGNVLKLDLIEFTGLKDLTDSSAYITSSCTELYIDEDISASNERKYPCWEKDHLRFSVAHEIGHISMHKDLIPRIRCNDIGDLKRLFNSNDAERNDYEQEANEFAGRLIAPVEKLVAAFALFGSTQTNSYWKTSATLRGAFCRLVSSNIGLNRVGVETRLDREQIWPSEWTYGG